VLLGIAYAIATLRSCEASSDQTAKITALPRGRRRQPWASGSPSAKADRRAGAHRQAEARASASRTFFRKASPSASWFGA